MSLERAAAELGWPSAVEILTPRREGARVLAAAAQDKVRRGLERAAGFSDVRVGILAPEDPAESTPAPIALVCEFNRVPSDTALLALHRIAWNYSKAPLLITVDPTCVRAWTCCETPAQDSGFLEPNRPEITSARVTWDLESIESQLTSALHWLNLICGRFFAEHEDRFHPAGRLDQVLLGNLKDIRQKLHNERLPYNIAHDLLGRVIFIQFLFQRTDSGGKAALNAMVLDRLADQGVLKERHHDLAGILANRSDTYRFFRWLDERFNGDLFPSKGDSPDLREEEWQNEVKQVKRVHLDLLSEFVGGRVHFDSGQRSLFPLYSFDTIPLEFISSIYEEFVSGTATPGSGVHYTPGHLVDLLLDGVLPWDEEQWDVKLLDPACGSGIFLVKAFQRLIHRWKIAH